jgi:hypothetical protein
MYCVFVYSQRVHQVQSTDHPEYPTRNVLLCKDSCVRILSPATGDVLTTLIEPTRRRLIDAAYAIDDGKQNTSSC